VLVDENKSIAFGMDIAETLHQPTSAELGLHQRSLADVCFFVDINDLDGGEQHIEPILMALSQTF
jgi:hypothetical protein